MTNEELKVVISAEIDDLKQGIQEAQGEIQGFSKKSESGFSKFGKAIGTAGKAVGAAGKVIGTAVVGITSAVAAGAAAIGGLSASTEEYRTAQSKLTTAFESAGSTAEQATETYNGLYRVLGDGDVAVEAANHLAQLTQDQQSLSEWTEICQGIYATFGDSLPIEGLTEAANETAKTGQLTGSLADALNWAGISEDEFQEKLDACATAQEREQLIRETLNNTYMEASKTYEQNAKDILKANEAQAKLEASLGAIGAAVTPIVTTFKSFGGTLLESVVPGFEQAAEGLQGLMEGTEGASEQLKEGLMSIIENLLNAFTEALPEILDIGIQLITSLIEGILQVLPEVVQTIVDVIPQITGALMELLPQLLEIGIEMIVQIIEGIAQMLPELLDQFVEMIPKIIDVLVDAIPKLLEAAIDFFMAIVEAIPEIIPEITRALPEIVDSIITVLLDSIPQLIEAGIELYMALVDAIPEIIPALVEAIPEIITTIIDAIVESIPEILEAGIDLFMAIVDSIPEVIPEILDGVLDIISGIVKGISDGVPKLLEAAKELFGTILTAIGDLIRKLPQKLGEVIRSIKTNLVDKAKQLMNFKWELPKIKLPHFSITGKFSLNPPQIPKFSVSWYKLGGIFDSPTLFPFGNGRIGGLGEDGAEAIVPLEKNTEWLDRIAEKLTQKSGSTPIILQVDGKTLAQTSIDSINQLTRQTGRLSLNLV